MGILGVVGNLKSVKKNDTLPHSLLYILNFGRCKLPFSPKAIHRRVTILVSGGAKSQAIEELQNTSSPGFYSRFFVVPKPDGSFCLIIDLKVSRSYHHVMIHPNIRKYFWFVVNSVTYQFRALPFDLSTVPREFTKTLAPVVQLLRSCGIQIHAYLGDWILHASSPLQAQARVQRTL